MTLIRDRARPALAALLVTVALAACSGNSITGPSAPATNLKRAPSGGTSSAGVESSAVELEGGDEPSRSGFLLSTGRGSKR